MPITCPVCNADVENFHLHLYENIAETEHILYIQEGILVLSEEMSDTHNFDIIDKHSGTEYAPLFSQEFLVSVMTRLGYNIRKRVGQNRKIVNKYDIPVSEFVLVIKDSIPYTVVSRHFDNDAFKVIDFYGHNFCSSCDTVFCDENDKIQFVCDGDAILSNFEMLCPKCVELERSKKKIAITKTFYFASAHHLPGYNGLCFFTHGHEWKLEVTVKRPVNVHSEMALDFVDLKHAVNETIIKVLDHNYLNDFVYNATAENLCSWIWNRLMIEGKLKGLENIRLWESPSSYADFSKSDMRDIVW